MSSDELTRVYRTYLAAVVRFHLAAAEAGGMGPTDYQASSILELDGPLSPGELADRLRLSRSATTRVIDRLVAAGIAERTVDAADRRKGVVAHTGLIPGEAIRLFSSVREPIGTAIGSLSAEQQEGLVTYFRSATAAYQNAIDVTGDDGQSSADQEERSR
ncbi:MarR family transcriptional regulator [uncultured Agrococcus sp.]|uniref:MarR family winged helix-turn-helix transcriptional regulator n=1 Tax=uncultured Agrococcus sp. TaxID=382258 RepID=UPI0025F968AE|nr:MarR family transcriptional regulator [uncultured Agrococcus sp.]